MESLREEIFDGVNRSPSNVIDALDALEVVAERLRELGDARAVFPDVYAIITRRVKESIVDGRGPQFLEGQWISRLAGLFCEYYLAALDASLDAFEGRATAGEAWDIAFQCSGIAGTAPSVNALLGINAHINYDLAQGLYDNIVQHGAESDDERLRRYHHDHNLVNEILTAAMPEVLKVLAERYHCPIALLVTLTKGIEETVAKAVLFALRQWRDRVWGDLSDLLAAATVARRSTVVARMNTRSALVARAVATGNGALRAGRPLFQSAAHALPYAA